MSNATARCVGFSFRSKLSNIDRKPWMAFVCCPAWVWKLSTGRAKNARNAREWPSMIIRVGFSESSTPPAYKCLPAWVPPTKGDHVQYD